MTTEQKARAGRTDGKGANRLVQRLDAGYFWFLGGAFVGAGFNYYTNILQFSGQRTLAAHVAVGALLWIAAGIAYTSVGWLIQSINQQTQGLSAAAVGTAKAALMRQRKGRLCAAVSAALGFTILGFLASCLPLFGVMSSQSTSLTSAEEAVGTAAQEIKRVCADGFDDARKDRALRRHESADELAKVTGQLETSLENLRSLMQETAENQGSAVIDLVIAEQKKVLRAVERQVDFAEKLLGTLSSIDERTKKLEQQVGQSVEEAQMGMKKQERREQPQ